MSTTKYNANIPNNLNKQVKMTAVNKNETETKIEIEIWGNKKTV